MKNQYCTREQKESLRLRPEFRPKTKKSSGPFVDRFCLFSFFYLTTLFLGKVLILKKKTKRVVVVRKKVLVCLSPVVVPFVRRRILLQRRTNHFIPVVVVIQRRRRRRVVPFCSVPFLTDRTQKNGRRRRDPRENLIISWKNARRFLPALTVVSLSRSIHRRRSLKNTLGSLRTEEEEGE